MYVIERAQEYFPDYLAVFDADIIIRAEDYFLLSEVMKSFRKDRYYVCQVDDLPDNDAIDYSRGDIYYEKIRPEARNRAMIGDLGGLYFVPFDILQSADIFDPRFTVWGGEDNAAAIRLQCLGIQPRPLYIRPLHLHHRSIESTSLNTAQYEMQVGYLMDEMRRIPIGGFKYPVNVAFIKNIIAESSAAKSAMSVTEIIQKYFAEPLTADDLTSFANSLQTCFFGDSFLFELSIV